ncbi:MAG: thioredoxin family protein [bacterium]|nr:thioredoxin family protein [bacterium]
MNWKRFRGWLAAGLIGLAAYFINVEVQTYLGEQALRETGLELNTLSAAQTSAQSQGRPILAALSAIWCPTCRKLDQTVFADPRVQKELKENFVFARIEYESEAGEDFMQKYNVRGFPNLLVLSPRGEIIQQLPIEFDPERFHANLARLR